MIFTLKENLHYVLARNQTNNSCLIRLYLTINLSRDCLLIELGIVYQLNTLWRCIFVTPWNSITTQSTYTLSGKDGAKNFYERAKHPLKMPFGRTKALVKRKQYFRPVFRFKQQTLMTKFYSSSMVCRLTSLFSVGENFWQSM